MPRAHIHVRHNADRLTVTYRLPGHLLSPVAWLWCLVGGLAVGIGLALALVATGALDMNDDPRAFRAALASGTAGGALVLYLGYAWAVLRARLRVVFDAARRQITLHLVAGQRRAGTFRLDDVVLFRLAEHAAGPGQGCILVMETTGDGPVALVTLPGACHTPATQLSNLAGQLNAYLEALRGGEPQADDYQPA